MNTAEYCKDTITGLEESVKQNLEGTFAQQVNFGDEEERFTQTINRGIEYLQAHVRDIIAPAFERILKILNFGQNEDMELMKDTQ
jgi:hypothetical protein